MIRPLNENVIVKPQEFKKETESGLILTTTTTEKPSEGIVLAKAKSVSKDINEGDTVLYSKYAGSIVSDGVQELLILEESDLLGIRE